MYTYTRTHTHIYLYMHLARSLFNGSFAGLFFKRNLTERIHRVTMQIAVSLLAKSPIVVWVF